MSYEEVAALRLPTSGPFAEDCPLFSTFHDRQRSDRHAFGSRHLKIIHSTLQKSMINNFDSTMWRSSVGVVTHSQVRYGLNDTDRTRQAISTPLNGQHNCQCMLGISTVGEHARPHAEDQIATSAWWRATVVTMDINTKLLPTALCLCDLATAVGESRGIDEKKCPCREPRTWQQSINLGVVVRDLQSAIAGCWRTMVHCHSCRRDGAAGRDPAHPCKSQGPRLGHSGVVQSCHRSESADPSLIRP